VPFGAALETFGVIMLVSLIPYLFGGLFVAGVILVPRTINSL
jgi:hypothetical protein